MSIAANALRELHRIHQQVNDLQQRIERGPRQVRAGEATVARLETQLHDARENLQKIRVAADQKQLQLKEREDRIENLKSKLNTCGSNREYQALREQIAADQQANNVLSDEILELLERIDELQEETRKAENVLAQAQTELDKARDRVAQQQEGLKTQLDQAQTLLQQAEAALPGDLKQQYHRIVRARGEEALAEVQDQCCGTCHQLLSPQTMNELYIGRPVFCKSCGALLYLPEEDAGKPG